MVLITESVLRGYLVLSDHLKTLGSANAATPLECTDDVGRHSHPGVLARYIGVEVAQ